MISQSVTKNSQETHAVVWNTETNKKLDEITEQTKLFETEIQVKKFKKRGFSLSIGDEISLAGLFDTRNSLIYELLMTNPWEK